MVSYSLKLWTKGKCHNREFLSMTNCCPLTSSELNIVLVQVFASNSKIHAHYLNSTYAKKDCNQKIKYARSEPVWQHPN